jgi:hypothetical protein
MSDKCGFIAGTVGKYIMCLTDVLDQAEICTAKYTVYRTYDTCF